MRLVIHNPGDFELEQATVFGASVKDRPNAIGMFGTGIKYGIATLLRNGASVRLLTGGGEFIFHAKEKDVRGKSFEHVWMNDLPLNYTTQLGLNWEPWMAIRELYSNALDEGGGFVEKVPQGGTTFEIEGPEINLEPYFIKFIHMPSPTVGLLFQDETIQIWDRPSDWVFYQGFAAHKVPRTNARYTYNILKKMALSEERMLSDHFSVQSWCLLGVLAADDDDVLKQVTLNACWEAEQFKWTSIPDSSKNTWDWVRRVLLPYRREIKNAELSYNLIGYNRDTYVRKYTPPTPHEQLQSILLRFDKFGIRLPEQTVVYSDEEPPEDVIAIPTDCMGEVEDTIQFLLNYVCERDETDLETLFVNILARSI